MKIFMKMFVVGLLSVFFSQSSFAEDFDFRNVKWGMSKAQVKSSESLDVGDETQDGLLYKTQILNKNVLLMYNFVDNRLISSVYLIKERHTNNNDYIDDYETFKKTLTKKYGKPTTDKTIWKNNLYKDDPTHWGMAISMGHLLYVSEWETEDTKISIGLTGDNFKMNHGIIYKSKKLNVLKEKNKEKEALDAL